MIPILVLTIFVATISPLISYANTGIVSRSISLHQPLFSSASAFFQGSDITTRFDTIKQLKTFIDADVYPGDNYWSGTRNRFRSDFASVTNPQERRDMKNRYNAMTNMAVEKRIQAECDRVNRKYISTPEEDVPLHCMLNTVLERAQLSSLTNEMKELSFNQLKKDLISKRRGIFSFLPHFSHQLVDYIESLRKLPTKKILLRNIAFGVFFAALVIYNTGRRALTFAAAGNLIICSLLLSRGMPLKENKLGMNPNAVNWSTASWLSAFGITAMYSAPAALITKFILNRFQGTLPSNLKLSISIAVGIIIASLGTSFYEVFETKENGGWRWKKVENGFLPAELELALRDRVFGEDSGSPDDDMLEGYEFEYNPDVDDLGIVDNSSKKNARMIGIDMKSEQRHYEEWVKERKEKQREPSTFLSEDVAERMIGAKQNFFDISIPEELRDSYREITTRLNPWRKKKMQYKKNFVEDGPIVGPYAYREKTPDWLLSFDDLFSDKVTQRQKLARSYGTYRKSMYKKDDKVVLQPTDGAKDKPPALPKGDFDNENGGDGIEEFMNEQDEQL